MAFDELEKEFLKQVRLLITKTSGKLNCVVYVDLELWSQELRAACHEHGAWDVTANTLFGCEFYTVHTAPHGVKVYNKGG